MHPGTVLGLPMVPQGVTPLSILRQNCPLWLRSDRLVVVSGSDVLTWGDLSFKGHNFTAPVGNRPVYNVADANWGGKPSLGFDTSAKWLESDDAAGTWSFLHDGTGGILVVYRFNDATTSTIAGTAISTAEIGIRFQMRAGDQRIAIANGSGAFIIDDTVPAVVIDTNYYGYYAYQEGRPVNEYINAVIADESTGDSGLAPSAADPTSTLRIGSSTTGTQRFRGEMLEVIAFSPFPTAQQFIYLKAYLYRRYGLI